MRRVLLVACAAVACAAGLGLACSSGGAPPDDGDDSPAVVTTTIPAYLRDAVRVGTQLDGRGHPYDSILGRPLATGTASAVEYDGLERLDASIASRVTLTRVERSEDLARAVGVTATASVNGFFGFGADAKASWSRSKAFNTSDLYVAVHVEVLGPLFRATGVRLKDTARGLTADEFFNRYGDRFGSAVQTGAELFGVVHVKTQSEAKKEQLATELNLHYALVSVGSQFTQEQTSKLEQYEVTCDYQTQGLLLVLSGCDKTTFATLLEAFVESVKKDGGLDDPTRSLAWVHFSNYYELEGYPGLSSVVEQKVVARAAAADDFSAVHALLATDLARYFEPGSIEQRAYAALATDDPSRRALDALQRCDADLASYLKAIDPLATAPTCAADVLAGFRLAKLAETPGYVSWGFANGFVPMRVEDYDVVGYGYAAAGAARGIPLSPAPLMPSSDSRTAAEVTPFQYLLVWKGGTDWRLYYGWPYGAAWYFAPAAGPGAAATPRVEDAPLTVPRLLVNKGSGLYLAVTGAANTPVRSLGSVDRPWRREWYLTQRAAAYCLHAWSVNAAYGLGVLTGGSFAGALGITGTSAACPAGSFTLPEWPLDARFVRLAVTGGAQHAAVDHWTADPREENVTALVDDDPLAADLWVDADLWLLVPADRVE